MSKHLTLVDILHFLSQYNLVFLIYTDDLFIFISIKIPIQYLLWMKT